MVSLIPFRSKKTKTDELFALNNDNEITTTTTTNTSILQSILQDGNDDENHIIIIQKNHLSESNVNNANINITAVTTDDHAVDHAAAAVTLYNNADTTLTAVSSIKHDVASIIRTIDSKMTINQNHDTNNDHHQNYDSSSSSSDDDDDDDDESVLSDTEYATKYSKRYIIPPIMDDSSKSTSTTTTKATATNDDNNHCRSQRRIIMKQSTENIHNNNNKIKIHNNYYTHHQKDILFHKIEQHIYNQFQYRNQIWNHIHKIHSSNNKNKKNMNNKINHYNDNIIYNIFHKFYYQKKDIYLQSILYREYQVRYNTINRILFKLQNNNKKQQQRKHDDDDDVPIYTDQDIEQLRQRLYQMVRMGISENKNSNLYYNNDHKNYDHRIMFIRYMFLPATFSLFIHCIVHVTMYDGIISILDVCKNYFINCMSMIFTTNNSNSLFLYVNRIIQQYNDIIWSILVFIVGCILLRCSGDLFWWTSNHNYQLIKFDFHNRRQIILHNAISTSSTSSSSKQQQQRNDQVPHPTKKEDTNATIKSSHHTIQPCLLTRIVLFVRQYDPFRAIIFMFGYTCCYIATHDLLQNIQHWYINTIHPQWNYYNILQHLPSTKEIHQNGMCFVERHSNESFCSYTCQNELQQRANAFLSLKIADMEYTRNVLSSESYDQYWYYWIHNINLTYQNTYPSIMTNWNDTIDKVQQSFDSLKSNNDLPPLFLQQQQVIYCCIVILISISMLHMFGVKLWEKY